MSKRLDLIGQRFGRLLVTELAYVRKQGTYWKCLCNCGNEIIVCGKSLKSANTNSCGCFNKERISETCLINLIGQRFSRLLVVDGAGSDKDGRALWVCRCTCGNEIIVSGHSLRRDNSKSCGCLRREKISEVNKGKFGKNNPGYKHGLYGTKGYKNAMSAKRRAMKLNQTPILSQDEKYQIEMVYKKAQELGSNWHVDHIIPLAKGGLHHPDNLQIVVKKYNLQKSDKLDFRLPYFWESI